MCRGPKLTSSATTPPCSQPPDPGTSRTSGSGATTNTNNQSSGPVTLTVWAMGDEGDKLGNSDILQQAATSI
jgi:hypothetical protein